MSNDLSQWVAGKVRNWLEKKNPELSGAYSEWADLTPWSAVYSNGVFQGKDNSFWMFFKAPENVRIEWIQQENQAMDNQLFLNKVIGALAETLDTGSDSKLRDMKRGFCITKLRALDDGVHYDKDLDTPATIDFRKRMSTGIERPQWYGYMGVELKSKGLMDNAVSLQEFAEQFSMGQEDPLTRFLPDMEEIVEIMEDNNFTRLTNFDVNSLDYQNLTCWHGVENTKYGLPRHLSTTEFSESTDGFSVETPAWGEIQFTVAVPKEGLGLLGIKDPRGEESQWSRALFVTSNHTVGIWVNGQIRGKKALNSILRTKQTSRRGFLGGVNEHDEVGREKAEEELTLINEALSSATMENVDLLDNVEIIIASQCSDGEAKRLKRHLNEFDWDLRPPLHRQAKALLRTLPTYNKPISRIRRSNIARGEFSAQMLTGALSMSGLLKQTKPSAQNGILLGFTYGDNEFKDVFTEVDAAKKKVGAPTMLVTGRTGSGKTTQILMMISQVVYDARPAVFLNPKTDSSQSHYFEMLDGETISMSESYLRDNPGMLDPFQFFQERAKIASVLADAVMMALRLHQEQGSEVQVRESTLTAEINRNSLDTRNRCAYDIFFGNKIGRAGYYDAIDAWNRKLKAQMDKKGELERFAPEVDGALSEEGRRFIVEQLSIQGGTAPISDSEARKFIRNRMESSTFWGAFVSKDPAQGSSLRNALERGAPINIEWDGKLKLPDVTVPEREYRSDHIESVLSVNLAFVYAEEIITRKRNGGILVIDEAWVLKSSKEAQGILNKSGREHRSRNIMMVLATQMITDYAGTEAGDNLLLDHVDRFLFLATPDNPEERKAFFRISGLSEADKYWDYMLTAGIRDNDNNLSNPVAKGYYVDKIYNFSGGIMLGPWPKRELTMGRTDSEAERLRHKMLNEENIGLLEDVYSSSSSMKPEEFQKFISGSDSFQIDEN